MAWEQHTGAEAQGYSVTEAHEKDRGSLDWKDGKVTSAGMGCHWWQGYLSRACSLLEKLACP